MSLKLKLPLAHSELHSTETQPEVALLDPGVPNQSLHWEIINGVCRLGAHWHPDTATALRAKQVLKEYEKQTLE